MPLSEPAPAKLNLTLKVTGRRDDGYHLIDSVVVFSELGDTLTLQPDHALAFSADGPFASSLPPANDNLVLKAARLLGDAYGRQPAGRFHLTKRLPTDAGIGGGSADAAATIRLLARLWSISIDDTTLQSVALRLGADVPVCLRSRRSRMTGIGENVTAMAPEKGQPIVLVNPGVKLSTADVFGRLANGQDRKNASATPDRGNDLAWPAISLVPEISDILTELQVSVGCRTTIMSGSGPTCFGLFDSRTAAEEAATQLTANRPSWWVAATRLVD